MATVLDKDLIRESTELVDNREIVVTLTEDQRISMKLKGLKSGDVSIGISELYNQLNDFEKKPTNSVKKKTKDSDFNPMISLYGLRTNALVTKMDLTTKIELERLVCELIKEEVKIFENE